MTEIVNNGNNLPH